MSFQKVRVADVPEVRREKEGRLLFRMPISEALGRKPNSMDLLERHPFDVEMHRIVPGKLPYRYHSHSAQWEFYYVVSGNGVVRHADGETPVAAGDAFVFKPGEPHQLRNDGAEDLVVMVIADNPVGEYASYPDEAMYLLTSPMRYVVKHPDRDDPV